MRKCLSLFGSGRQERLYGQRQDAAQLSHGPVTNTNAPIKHSPHILHLKNSTDKVTNVFSTKWNHH